MPNFISYRLSPAIDTFSFAPRNFATDYRGRQLEVMNIHVDDNAPSQCVHSKAIKLGCIVSPYRPFTLDLISKLVEILTPKHFDIDFGIFIYQKCDTDRYCFQYSGGKKFCQFQNKCSEMMSLKVAKMQNRHSLKNNFSKVT